jgi:hypothetical protein
MSPFSAMAKEEVRAVASATANRVFFITSISTKKSKITKFDVWILLCELLSVFDVNQMLGE